MSAASETIVSGPKGSGWANVAGIASEAKIQVQYAKLLQRIRNRIDLEDTTVEIAGVAYPWTRVINQDRLLQQSLSRGEHGTVDTDPFWAATWRAAIGLDRFLGRLGPLDGKHVIELGGGSGRAGIAAALRGARVEITDASNLAMLVCRYNARWVSDRVEIRKLDWGDTKPSRRRYPIILGSDIVYDPSLYPILEPCLRRLIESNGRVYLSEPQRHTGDRFEVWIRNAGWKCDIHFVDLGDGAREIRIFECQLP